jgi:hypothetical protein
MKNLCAVVAAASLLATSALAQTPLAPGKPAGLLQAQEKDDNTLLYVAGIGLVAAGIGLLASGSSNNGAASSVATTGGGTTTTTTTTTTTKAATTST